MIEAARSAAHNQVCRMVLGAVLMAMGGGCVSLPGPKMELAEADDEVPADGGRWWWSQLSDAPGRPVVGVEQRVSPDRVRQWLIDDRGVRCFEYQDGRVATHGPPVGGGVVEGDFGLVISLIRTRFGRSDEPGWPGPALPADEVARLIGTRDLVTLLDRHWPATRSDPPAGLTAHQIRQAMDASEITLDDLLVSGL
ncbi:MAG: hypothetical protein GY778_29650 [bacterium]|nr:hypothetical protein [bacterium]